VRVTGTDGWSWDAPFSTPRTKYLAPVSQPDMGGHRAGREIGYCHIEKLNPRSASSGGFSI